MTARRGRVQLWLLLGLFAAPPLAALLLYFVFPQWIPGGRTNHGTLLDPARPLPAFALVDEAGRPLPPDRKWTLLYAGGHGCDAACAAVLAEGRQVWHALDKDRQRVRRVYVAPDAAALAQAKAALQAQHWDLAIVADAGTAGARLADALGPQPPNALFLLDPNGNWVMTFDALSEKDLYRDLRRLLRFSHIG